MNDLALRSTVRELVAVFAAAEVDIRSSFAAIVAAEARLNAAFALGDSRKNMRVDASGYGYHDNFVEIGPRVIVGSCIERGYGKNAYQVTDWSRPRCTALDNVFSGLDGKGTITPTHYGPLGDAIRACGPSGSGETDYFAFRVFKNGNLHIHFKRLDLLAKFNAIAGGLHLKPEAA